MTNNINKLILMILCTILIVFPISTLALREPLITGGTTETRTYIKEYLTNTNTTQYVKTITLKNYQSKYYDAYAWYNTKTIHLYQQTWTEPTKLHNILRHELGHLIAEAQHQNTYNYNYNEWQADNIAEGLP